MARTGDDSWDLASSVGVTATMVAAGRAAASADPRGLINDPFAEPLVRAVGLDFFTSMLDGELDMSQFPGVSPERVQAMVDSMAVRTKFFDDYLTAATAAGVRQVVILASGLDARAYRLAWPTGTVVYEIDQPDVIEFKTQTLAGLGAEPTATRRTVVDRSARGLAGRAAGGRIRRSAADRVAGRGAADLPAAGCSGPAVRPDHAHSPWAARSAPNMHPASWISMPRKLARCPRRCANRAWTSTCPRWCMRVSATT